MLMKFYSCKKWVLHQASIKMAPYEALYGRQCRTPLFWSQTGESQVFEPEVLKDAERQIQMVRECLKVAQSRQKSYAYKRRIHDVFHVSQLKKCLRVPEEQLPMEYLDLGGDLTYSERPIKILDIAE
jgi:hypothetical protein